MALREVPVGSRSEVGFVGLIPQRRSSAEVSGDPETVGSGAMSLAGGAWDDLGMAAIFLMRFNK